ncbi:hypothetical protein B0H13DRAFT_1908873 [Mycena leptocephala]|nr:hypothetical protein B0H13DRAFT_1908873 [Mycena leptocephala]
MTSPGFFWRKKLRRISRAADKTASEGEGKILKCAMRVVLRAVEYPSLTCDASRDTREKKGRRHECRYKYITGPGIAQYPSHTLSRSRALAHSRKGPELQRAARERAIQRVRVSRAAWRLVAELHGIFERACIGSRRRWMASGGDEGGVRDEKRVPRPLQQAGREGDVGKGERWLHVLQTPLERRRDWSDHARGTGGPDGGAGAEHQGVLTQALRMHSVLRVVRSHWVGDSRGGREGTEATVWKRDAFKDGTLQSGNRIGAMRNLTRGFSYCWPSRVRSGDERVRIWTEGKKARKVGRNEWGKEMGKTKPRVQGNGKETDQQRRLRGYPKPIAEGRVEDASVSAGEAQKNSSNAWTKLWSRQTCRYRHYVKVRRENACTRTWRRILAWRSKAWGGEHWSRAVRWRYESESDVATLMAATGKRHERGAAGADGSAKGGLGRMRAGGGMQPDSMDGRSWWPGLL